MIKVHDQLGAQGIIYHSHVTLRLFESTWYKLSNLQDATSKGGDSTGEMKADRVMRADKKTIFSLAPDFQVDKNTRLGNFTLEGKLIFFNDKEIPHRNQSMIVPTD